MITMTNPIDGQMQPQFWSAPLERVVVMAMLCMVLICVIAALVILAIHGDMDKASVAGILGTVAGGIVTALVHKLSTRSTDNGV